MLSNGFEDAFDKMLNINSEEETTIHEALGKKFSYSELMNN